METELNLVERGYNKSYLEENSEETIASSSASETILFASHNNNNACLNLPHQSSSISI